MRPTMSDRRLSATEVFIDAVRGLCLHEAKLEDVTEAATALHDASALATTGTATLAACCTCFARRSHYPHEPHL